MWWFLYKLKIFLVRFLDLFIHFSVINNLVWFWMEISCSCLMHVWVAESCVTGPAVLMLYTVDLHAGV